MRCLGCVGRDSAQADMFAVLFAVKSLRVDTWVPQYPTTTDFSHFLIPYGASRL
jgi:hypothetical protein